MGIISSIKKVFEFSAGQKFTSTASGSSAAVGNVKNFVNWMIANSDFAQYSEEDLYEHFYKYEPEVGGSIERMSAMVRESFKYFTVENFTSYDNLMDVQLNDFEMTLGQADLSLTNEMLDVANYLSKKLKIPDLYEMYSEIIQLHGMLLLEKDGLSQIVIPNARATIIDDKKRISGNVTDKNGAVTVITESKYIVIDEQEPTERIIDNFIIKKFRDTPISMKDKFGRDTYGIYAISPLQRAIIPIWQKRLIVINDVIWRNKNVPREHHTISTDAFNPLTYQGTPSEIKQAIDGDVRRTLSSYKSTVEDQPSDMVYITTDAVNIKSIEHTGTAYMSPNELLNQISSQIWSSLNVPKSIVEGSSSSSYSSEVLMSSYTAMRVRQLAEKVGDVILENMKERLLAINPKYPVDILTIKHDFVLDNNKLEALKGAALAASLNSYTRSELREMATGDAPLTEQQLINDVIINTGNDINGLMNHQNEKSTSTNISVNNRPLTSISKNQQPTTQGSSPIDNILQDKSKDPSIPSVK